MSISYKGTIGFNHFWKVGICRANYNAQEICLFVLESIPKSFMNVTFERIKRTSNLFFKKILNFLKIIVFIYLSIFTACIFKLKVKILKYMSFINLMGVFYLLVKYFEAIMVIFNFQSFIFTLLVSATLKGPLAFFKMFLNSLLTIFWIIFEF